MSYDDYLNNILTNSEELHIKFKAIPADLTKKNYTAALHRQNSFKNNFNNILPSEETRVKLLTRDDSDYMNANYILDKYIATQQPNMYSYIDFWKMVFEQNVYVVVNLSGKNEYLDIANPYFDYQLKPTILSSTTHYEIRNITITDILTNTTKTIYHLTLNQWPDFGVPDENELYKVIQTINLIDHDPTHKIIVHCKAGVGRSGTFILIHYLFRKFKENTYPDIIETIRTMRQSRIGMVQDKSQFQLVLNMVKRKLQEEPSYIHQKQQLTTSAEF
jgi:receptor-type tyrosine-protein phosphatase eta